MSPQTSRTARSPPLSSPGSVRGQPVAGLPVGISDSGGTWAMAGLNNRVPVKNVQAAQSPLNIMCIIRHSPGGRVVDPHLRRAVRSV
ncbi:hypothetical protein HZS38_02255 [Xenorhabdus nematophila]|nr:hypothetical protein D3790_02600 [Xenorhabdus nematophila]MBA0018069.1 hypothetical protein [Xenorhabdus nematophila]MCB4426976.1 hypothetical protein [Xenorhabdus nematophila]QNJ38279.1 hypothetical protein H8F46_02560 [Xenorhabdus nematophila]